MEITPAFYAVVLDSADPKFYGTRPLSIAIVQNRHFTRPYFSEDHAEQIGPDTAVAETYFYNNIGLVGLLTRYLTDSKDVTQPAPTTVTDARKLLGFTNIIEVSSTMPGFHDMHRLAETHHEMRWTRQVFFPTIHVIGKNILHGAIHLICVDERDLKEAGKGVVLASKRCWVNDMARQSFCYERHMTGGVDEFATHYETLSALAAAPEPEKKIMAEFQGALALVYTFRDSPTREQLANIKKNKSKLVHTPGNSSLN